VTVAISRPQQCLCCEAEEQSARSSTAPIDRDALRYAVLRRWLVDEEYFIKGMPQAQTRDEVDALCDAEIAKAEERGRAV
jgi:hypothetical protein